ncbi:leukocyte immunoglobulin-like receptor subfamily B member 2 isoform X2 [Peromyscus californicus insignis]|uniref:leukocyte immunoglobulin-like receptor subfamily B member 2 isoform X2 n=1 Tax=Peromyscus californicus insignis TaxID=564181 RepID=UPI0022A7CD93|nr:leukocyte immunoglobulin-like receptor subfamily B member 2 isoform X2 [Peromyscus californicus insignis]
MDLGAALLGLGFLMAQKIWAQYGPPPQPSIWAVPGSVISTGSAVTIFCRTPPGVTSVRLTYGGKWFDRTLQGDQEVCEFSLQNVTHSNAGVYYCDYFMGGEWSGVSDKLELVMTGVHKEKPSLTVDSGPQGFSEINATLHCHTHGSFNIFILCRGGNASFPQNCSQQDHNTFFISHVSLEHLRTYRCFGCHKPNSLLCSLPSDPLESSILGPPPQPSIWAVPGSVISTGSAVTIFCRTPPGVTRVHLSHFVPNEKWFDCTPQGGQEVFEFSLQNMTHSNAGVYYCDYFMGSEWSRISDKLELVVTGPSVPIVVWVSVAAACFLLFLLLLFICLCRHCAQRRASNGKTRSHVKYKSSSTAMDIEEKHKYGDLEGIQPEDCRKVDTQVSAAENSQEVTYAQLCQENFRKNMNPLPSNTPQGTSTHTCVYATLTLSQEKSQS